MMGCGGSVDGWAHPDFLRVASTLRWIISSYGGGAAACVYHRGVPVVDVWGGHRNRAGDHWARDTMAPSFSTTKGVASTLVHIMVDRGLLRYDDYVCEHWPKFAQAGKEHITVRHVLAHQSGLYHIRQMIDHADRMLDWDHMNSRHRARVADPRARHPNRVSRPDVWLSSRRDLAAGHPPHAVTTGARGARQAAWSRRDVHRHTRE